MGDAAADNLQFDALIAADECASTGGAVDTAAVLNLPVGTGVTSFRKRVGSEWR
jgi:hypothetical protein